MTVFGYAFAIDWSRRSWQLFAVIGSVLSIAILFWIDWTYRKMQVAEARGNAALREEAERMFPWIERVVRARTMLFIVYCLLVLCQATLYLNTRQCWFVPAANVQAWADWLYGEKSPQALCSAFPKS